MRWSGYTKEGVRVTDHGWGASEVMAIFNSSVNNSASTIVAFEEISRLSKNSNMDIKYTVV